MIHIFLLIICILSVEIILRLNLLLSLDSIINITKRVSHIITQDKISDHWKEKIIPIYALKIMQHSLKILFILLVVLSLFLITNFIISDFMSLTLSIVGIIESIIFAFAYIFAKQLFIK